MKNIFLDNYPDHVDKVLQETIDFITDSDRASNNTRRSLIYVGVATLIVISLIILIYGN